MNQQDNEQTIRPSAKKHQPKQVEDIVIENEQGFQLDWNSIEENVKRSRRHKHRRHRHSSRHSSPTSTDSGTRLKHTVHIDEKAEKKKKPLIAKILIGLLLLFLCVGLGITIAFLVLRYQGEKELFNNQNLNIQTIEGAQSQDGGQTILYKDKKYTFNPYVTSILFMGIDKEELSLEDNVRGTGGQADAIYLLAYNASNGQVKIISFSRDTVVDINQYTESGNYAGVLNSQLCLAYAYGDGKELSAQNVITSLQRIIYNIPINSYFAMDLSAINVINDEIGGVTLTPLSTFGQFVEGETLTLLGDQAEAYVRTRDVTILDSNVDRTKRQQQYITSFANQLVPAVKKDIMIPLDLYNNAKEYVVTNLSPSKITYLASSIATSYNGLNIVSVPGTITANEEDGKAIFTPDSEKLYEILLDTFYISE